ncbi:hypothetical protein FOA43_000042 [Brettanomyces nanus]|uniref:Uncharacterized protein n=1 Tax=Eeniella nana TaxID=13502 RepID=A0A875RVA7_EENNA|nr:uncharacterized protein FOA43_000042 [Brettanomyces nanus]QPG72741.1 hypothetical protein FOA43_000042 [Brettanomyces nanus]
MSNLGFEEGHREISRQLESCELTCRIVEFLDKVIVDIQKDGEMDVSYDIQLGKTGIKKHPIGSTIEENVYDAVLDNNIVPTSLLDGSCNVKNQVVASQIGKLMGELQKRNVIVNMSGKLFKGTEFEKSDFQRLQIVVKLVRDTYEKKS